MVGSSSRSLGRRSRSRRCIRGECWRSVVVDRLPRGVAGRRRTGSLAIWVAPLGIRSRLTTGMESEIRLSLWLRRSWIHVGPRRRRAQLHQ